MKRSKESSITCLLVILTVAGALRMHLPQPYAWTVIWSVCFAFGSIALIMHFLSSLAEEPR